MSLLVLVFSEETDDLGIHPETVARLAALGVTEVAVVADSRGSAVVLQGWAFDPASCGVEAAAIVGRDRACRALRPLMQMTVPPGVRERSL